LMYLMMKILKYELSYQTSAIILDAVFWFLSARVTFTPAI